MRQEYQTIHRALHTPNQYTVEVNGIHRFIKKDRKGRRYMFFTDYDTEKEYLLVAVNKNITVVTPMICGLKCTFDRITIRGMM
jgi:hypothetical protein